MRLQWRIACESAPPKFSIMSCFCCTDPEAAVLLLSGRRIPSPGKVSVHLLGQKFKVSHFPVFEVCTVNGNAEVVRKSTAVFFVGRF